MGAEELMADFNVSTVAAGEREPAYADAVFDVAGAASYLGVKERLIRRLVVQRRVAYVKTGRFVRFKRADLDAYVADHRHQVGLGNSRALEGDFSL
jgi:excisionase family DNA binding protein